jgi:hypothetical protein
MGVMLDHVSNSGNTFHCCAGESGACLNILKSFGYFEKFWKTTAIATWENCRLFVSHRVHFSCTICLAMMQLFVYFEV